MNNENGTQMGAMNNGQMGPTGNWQPQPQSQPQMMRAPKSPMNPAKKKRLILGISLGVGGTILAIIGVVVLVILMKVDYGESYRVAKELKSKVVTLNSDYGCQRVINYVDSDYVSEATYGGYVEECATTAEGVGDLVASLGQTSGVKRDKELKAQFDRFREAINAVLPNEEELKLRLEIYQTWHKFVVMADDLSASNSSDAEIQNVAKVLTDSGNETLAKYGAGWLEKTSAYIQAYRAYHNTPGYSSELRTVRDEKNAERKDWIATNKPDIAAVGGLSSENRGKMYTEFMRLYNMIVELYEKNYDSRSGDCTEFLGEVICD